MDKIVLKQQLERALVIDSLRYGTLEIVSVIIKCVAAQNHEKFSVSRSFNVIDVGIP